MATKTPFNSEERVSWGPHKLHVGALRLQNEAGHATCGKFAGQEMQLHPRFKGLTFITTGTPKYVSKHVALFLRT